MSSSSVSIAPLEEDDLVLPASVKNDKLDKLTVRNCTPEAMRQITFRFDCPYFTTILPPSPAPTSLYATLETRPIGTIVFWIRNMAKSARDMTFMALRCGDLALFQFVMQTFSLPFTHEHVGAFVNASQFHNLDDAHSVARLCGHFPTVVGCASSSSHHATAAEILCHAASVGNEKLVQVVLEYCRKEKVTYEPQLSRAVYNASARGHASILEHLLFDHHWLGRIGALEKALKIASYNGHAAATESLLFHLDIPNAALKCAAICNHMEIVKWLLLECCALEDAGKFKAALNATKHGHRDLLILLMSAKSVVTPSNATELLVTAAKYGQLELVRLIRNSYASSVRLKDGVQLAVQHGHVDVASYLLPLAHDEIRCDFEVLSAMYIQAIEQDSIALVKLLLDHFSFALNKGLKRACAHGSIELVAYFIERGAEVSAGCIRRCVNNFNRNRIQTNEMLTYLVKHAPLDSLQNKSFALSSAAGNMETTATVVKICGVVFASFGLEYECIDGKHNLDSIKAVLLLGEHSTVRRTRRNKCSVLWCRERGLFAEEGDGPFPTRRLCLRHSPNRCIDTRPRGIGFCRTVGVSDGNNGALVFLAAVRRNRLSLVELLIEYGANLAVYGARALEAAVEIGHYDIVKCLIRNGVQPHASLTKRGHSKTIRAAVKHGRAHVLRLLLALTCASERAQRRFDAFILASKYDKLDSMRHIITEKLEFAEALPSVKQCIICFAAPKEVILPCGHYDVCAACAGNTSQCAICRLPYRSSDVRRVFES